MKLSKKISNTPLSMSPKTFEIGGNLKGSSYSEIVENTAQFVRAELDGICSAHDFYHIERVWKLAKKLYQGEKRGDELVIELGVLLHESFDEKFYSTEQLQNKKITLKQFLHDQGLDEQRLSQVFFVIEHVGYGKSSERGTDFVLTPELEIVEYADRLEAIGAIAIARTFSYGGKKQRAIYNPNAVQITISDKKSYLNNEGSSVQHFYDKLLKLKDLLHTDSVRKLATGRHLFMEQFLKQFFDEWNL